MAHQPLAAILWYRNNLDGYGEHDDGRPFDGTGTGRAPRHGRPCVLTRPFTSLQPVPREARHHQTTDSDPTQLAGVTSPGIAVFLP